MTTRERIERYQQLRHEDPALAEQFLAENTEDRRFTSLVETRKEILAAFDEILTEEMSEDRAK